MNKFMLLAVSLLLLCARGPEVSAADSASSPKWEYAIVKWDGPDRLSYNMPDKFDLVFLNKIGVTVPKGAEAEEWCLTYAANKLAKDGWETVTLNSRRILLRRAVH